MIVGIGARDVPVLPWTDLPYSDELLMPIGAPSVFGVISQQQQLMGQRAQAEATGRESLVEALNREWAARQAAAREARQRSFALQMAARQAEMERQRQAAAEDRASLAEALRLLDQSERQIAYNKSVAENDAATMATAAVEDEDRQRKDTLFTSLNTIKDIGTRPYIGPYMDVLNEAVTKARQSGLDDSSLKAIQTSITQKAEAQEQEYRSAQQLASQINKHYRDALSAHVKSKAELIAQKLQEMGQSLSPPAGAGLSIGGIPLDPRSWTGQKAQDKVTAETVSKWAETAPIAELERVLLRTGYQKEIADIVKTTIELAGAQKAPVMRDPHTGEFVPSVPPPPAKDKIAEIFNKALQIPPPKPIQRTDVVKAAQEARMKAAKAFEDQINAIRASKYRLLRLAPSNQSTQPQRRSGIPYRPIERK